MQRNNLYIFILIFALGFSLVFSPGAFAQTTTGRVAGVVTDKETGEPLPGANVTIVGSQMGAATDINGEYLIQNVPVGVYAVQASFVGYTALKIENIRVRIGLTERIPFQLSSAAIEGEAVTITAERPLIEKTSTNTSRMLNAEQFENLPVRGVAALTALTPGVVRQDGNTYIRGSRENAVGYYLEGVSVRDVVSTGNTATVIQEALEEVQVQTGGYSAQYGNANGGVVAQVLRSGGPTYNISFRTETDNFVKNNEMFLDTPSQGYSDHVLTVSGPVPYTNNKLRFFVAGENVFYRDRSHQFYTPFKFENGVTLLDNGQPMYLVDSGLRGGVVGDTVDVLDWKGVNVPFGNSLNQFNYNTVLTYEISKPLSLRLSAVGTYQDYTGNGDPIANMLNPDRFGKNIASNITTTAKLTHVLSPNAFYTVNFAFQDRRGKSYDRHLGDENYWHYADSSANAAAGFPQYVGKVRGPAAYDFYYFPFNRYGARTSGYSFWNRNYIGGNMDFTWQLHRHQIMFGGEYQYWTLRQFTGQTGTGTLTYLRQDPDILNDQERLDRYMASLGPNNWGYDFYGNETDEGVMYSRTPHPKLGAFYLQDRYEFRDLVLNAGLRMDYYDFEQYAPNDPRNPGYKRGENSLDESFFEKVKPFYALSPRVGFAFPVTDRTKLHAQWGKFRQMPEMDRIYISSYSRSSALGGGYFYTDPPAWKITPEITTQYEIGFAHQFSSFASFDMVLFYKDIKDQLQTRRIFPSPEANISSYDITVNGDFATTKGMEFRYTMRRTNRIMGMINYTFSQAKGTGSYRNQSSPSLDQGSKQISIISPLYFNRTHQGNINVDYRFGKDDGGPILERLGLNALLRFNSGHPFTLSGGTLGQAGLDAGSALAGVGNARFRRPVEPVGASTTPWNFYLDLRLDKTVTLFGMDVNFYVYSDNVLNTKNVLNVFPFTGSDIDGFLTNPDFSAKILATEKGPGYKKMIEAINNGNGRNWGERGFLWDIPRRIRAGIYINY